MRTPGGRRLELARRADTADDAPAGDHAPIVSVVSLRRRYERRGHPAAPVISAGAGEHSAGLCIREWLIPPLAITHRAGCPGEHFPGSAGPAIAFVC